MTEQYDVMCPICGTVNKGLYLNETDGWMICERCQTEVCDMAYVQAHSVRIPVYRMSDIPRLEEKKAV